MRAADQAQGEPSRLRVRFQHPYSLLVRQPEQTRFVHVRQHVPRLHTAATRANAAHQRSRPTLLTLLRLPQTRFAHPRRNGFSHPRLAHVPARFHLLRLSSTSPSTILSPTAASTSSSSTGCCHMHHGDGTRVVQSHHALETDP